MWVAVAALFIFSGYAHGEGGSAFTMLSPDTSGVVVGKRPTLKWKIGDMAAGDALLVMMDGVDITALVRCDDGGICIYRPFQVLAAGDHSVQFIWRDREGLEHSETVQFQSRQTSLFQEAYTSTEASVNYQAVLDKRDQPQIPYSKADSEITSEASLKTTRWHFTAKSQFRYLDQNLPVMPPQEKGIDLVNFLVSSGYQKDAMKMEGELGDVQVSETQNTVNGYARRGGQLFLDYKALGLHAFSVQTDQVFGLDGGLGIGTDPFDQLTGISGSLSLLKEQLKLKTLFAKGGERGSSFGISTLDGGKKGEVAALVMEAALLDQRLSIEGEYDVSKYDGDTSDEFGQESDKAYRIKLAWNGSTFGADASYEYMGPEYEVIGNQGLPKNREGFTLGGRIMAPVHSLDVRFSRFNDNVEDDDLYPTVYTSEGSISYTFSKFQSLPISISYQKSIQDSSDEPEYTPETDFHTDTVNLNLTWIKGLWNLGIQGGYSYMNDKTGMIGDTTTVIFSFTPSYSGTHLQITPMFSYNKSITHIIDVETDTYTANLDLQWQMTKRLHWSAAGNYNIMQADDDSMDQRNLNLNCRLAYKLMEGWRSVLEHPTVGIRGQYAWQEDKIYHMESDSYAVLIDFTANIKLTF